MKALRLAIPIAVLAVLALAGGAQAHRTAYTPDDRIRLVYGSLGEPLYTFQKSGLDLGIFDNATDAPVTGLGADVEAGTPARINVSLLYGGARLDLTPTMVAQHGRNGWYTYPYVLTQPGVYSLRIEGTINGTVVQLTIPPLHEVRELDEIMWPARAPLPDEQQAQLDALRADFDAALARMDRTRGLPGFEGPAVLLAVAAALAVATPRLPGRR
ncbi:MAG TPA: hypothetical protein VM681_04940 [Candidatus Thermoplasmatota archaeon]|nr:hypothetical protein [Candidatus Thermoplasmatota archaeon]